MLFELNFKHFLTNDGCMSTKFSLKQHCYSISGLISHFTCLKRFCFERLNDKIVQLFYIRYWMMESSGTSERVCPPTDYQQQQQQLQQQQQQQQQQHGTSSGNLLQPGLHSGGILYTVDENSDYHNSSTTKEQQEQHHQHLQQFQHQTHGLQRFREQRKNNSNNSSERKLTQFFYK